MKITYTLWESDHHHHTAERTIDTYDFEGIRRDFENALDLRDLGVENRKLKDAVADAWSTMDNALSCGVIDECCRRDMERSRAVAAEFFEDKPEPDPHAAPRNK